MFVIFEVRTDLLPKTQFLWVTVSCELVNSARIYGGIVHPSSDTVENLTMLLRTVVNPLSVDVV